MAKQTINIGASPNDGTGTPLRTAFDYCNLNFTELYTATGPSGNNIVVPGSATITGAATVGTTLGVTGVSTFAAGTALLPALTTTGDTNTGIYYPAADTFAVTTGGTERYRVNASGVLLLGRTSALSAETFSSVGFALIGGATHQAIIGEASGNVFAGSFTNTAFRIRTNNTEVAQFDATGNVGIGVTPSAATEKTLQIGARSTLSHLNFGNGYTVLANNFIYNSGNKYIANGPATNYTQFDGAHLWYNAPTGTAGDTITLTQAMTLDASGNLLVGTTSGLYRGQFAVAAGADRNIFTAQVTSASNGLQVQWNHATTTLRVVLSSIPTSAAGLAAGTLWNDAGTIKIA